MKYSDTSPSPDGLTSLRSDSSSLWPKVSPTGTATVTWCVTTTASSVGGASGRSSGCQRASSSAGCTAMRSGAVMSCGQFGFATGS